MPVVCAPCGTMWRLHSALGFLLLVACTSAQNFTCPDDQTLRDTLGFPTCADSMDPDYDVCDEPVFPNNTCRFSLFSNDSTDFGAQLTIYATNLGQNDTITIEGLKDLVTIPRYTGSSVVRAVLPLSGDPKRPFATITIVASDTSSITFGYYVTKTKLTAVKTTTQLSVGSGKLAQFINLKTAQPGDSWEITADQQIALSAAALEAINEPLGPMANNFLNIWMYEGIGANKTFVGSLYSALTVNNNLPMVSAGMKATLLYMLEPLNSTFEGTIVVNENSNLVDCSTYTVDYASDSILSKQLFNTGNYACYTVLTDPDDTLPFYLSGLSDGNGDQLSGTIYLLAGGPVPVQNASSSSGSLAVYSNSSQFTTPQLIPGYARTFISPSFRLWLFFARDIYTHATDPNFGRKGFVMTFNYPYPMANQNAALTLIYSYPFNFTFTVVNSYLSPDAMLTIQGSKIPIYKERVGQIIGKTISVVDSTIQLTIDQDTATDGGAYLTYEVIRDVNEPLSCPDGNIYLPGSNQTQQPLSGILPSNFNCSFTFVLNDDVWYTIIDSLQAQNMAAGEYVEVRSQFNTVRSTENSTYFTMTNTAFPGPAVTIFVSTGGSTQMTLQYLLHAPTWPQVFPKPINLANYEDAYYLQFKTVNDITSWQINSDSPMSFVSALSSFYTPFSLLNFFVYEGAGDDKQLVGTLYGTDQQFWSSATNTTTIFFAQPNNILFEGALVVSPSTNVEGCKYYSALWSNYEFYRNPYIYEYHVSVDATRGPSCLLIVNDYDETSMIPKDVPIVFGYVTMKGLIVENTSPFIIAGSPVAHARNSSTRMLGSFYNGNSNYFDIPQVFDGRSRTLYVPTGTLDFLITADPTKAPSVNVAGPRSGFISTNNYPFISTEQEGSAVLQASSPYQFTFNVRQTPQPAVDPFMNIITDTGNYSSNFTGGLFGNTFTFVASQVNVYLYGGHSANSGLYVQYTATAANVTTTAATTTTTVTTTGPINGGNTTVGSTASSTITTTTPGTTTRGAKSTASIFSVVIAFYSFFL